MLKQYLMNWGVRKPDCQSCCPWPTSPAAQWGRQTRFPPSAGGGRYSLSFDGAPCPALHMDWTLPRLSLPPSVCCWVNSSKLEVKFLLSFCPHCILWKFSTSTSLHHPDWGWVFPPRRSGCWWWRWAREKAREWERSLWSWEDTREDSMLKRRKNSKDWGRAQGKQGKLRLRWGGEGVWLGMILYGAFRRMRRQPGWRQRKASGDRQLSQFIQ